MYNLFRSFLVLQLIFVSLKPFCVKRFRLCAATTTLNTTLHSQVARSWQVQKSGRTQDAAVGESTYIAGICVFLLNL